MKREIITIDSNFNNESLDLLINSCVYSKPFMRGVPAILTEENFFNTDESNSIRSAAGLLDYYKSLNDDEVSSFRGLFKLMQSGLHIFISFEEDERNESDGKKLPFNYKGIYDCPIVYKAGYNMDENQVCHNLIGGKIPGTSALVHLINAYNEETLNCKLSLEGLLAEARKQLNSNND